MADTRNDRVEPTEAEAAATDANRDPITGEPGMRALGTGLRAAGGVTAGAAGGAAAGPVGAVGGGAGGLAGKGVAESIDPTAEDQYWSENEAWRPYYDPSTRYDEYRPTYRYG
ncbi:MAG: hypothetical protein JO116_09885 [Planctomycetaceae bacterium]|nr:hypothetical protein [Planctomycetaceae bacterium]